MKKNRLTPMIALLLILALLSGCAPQIVEKVVEKEVMVERAPEATRAAEAPAYAGDSSQSAADEGGYVGERMIIQTVDMSIVVENTEKVLDELNAMAKSYKGYIADSRKWYQNDQAFASVTLRVPAESLDEVLGKIHGLALKVENENKGGQDVTEDYTDLSARLRNMEAAEKELLALLTEVRENQGKAEDILAVYRELTNIRSQIESLKGRTQYLERMTALATITVQIRPKEAPRPVVEEYRWSPLITVNKALRAFVVVLQRLADLAIILVIFSPFVLVPLAVIWLIVHLVRRAKRRKKGETAPKGQ
jgi:hypothetical protein